jgi:hypothetical protein
LPRAIPPDAERLFAKRMRATTVEMPTNLEAIVSHPDDVVKLIETAAEAVAVSTYNLKASFAPSALWNVGQWLEARDGGERWRREMEARDGGERWRREMEAGPLVCPEQSLIPKTRS